MPQHCDEAPQEAPWLWQLVPLEQIPFEHDSEPQHCEELVHDAPEPLQPEAPEQTPLEQVDEPQHCEELEHEVPALWQPPPLQTWLELQVSTPQQSPLDWHRWLFCWHGPVRFGSLGGSDGEPQASARVAQRASKSERVISV